MGTVRSLQGPVLLGGVYWIHYFLGYPQQKDNSLGRGGMLLFITVECKGSPGDLYQLLWMERGRLGRLQSPRRGGS